MNPVNDAPAIAGTVLLTEADEASTDHAADAVSALLAAAASDVDGTVIGFAITANAAVAAERAW